MTEAEKEAEEIISAWDIEWEAHIGIACFADLKRRVAVTLAAKDAEIERLKQALNVASEVRKAQKLYFKSRKQDDLIASKRIEAALDVRLAELERLGL
jgi:hypothetical protein